MPVNNIWFAAFLAVIGLAIVLITMWLERNLDEEEASDHDPRNQAHPMTEEELWRAYTYWNRWEGY